jgi:hypothetical protein
MATAGSIVGVFVVMVAMATVIGWLAARKGHSPVVWGLLGVFVFLPALIVVLLIPEKKPSASETTAEVPVT